MKYAKYVSGERRIVAADGSGILERWRWGRELLADPQRVNSAGTLLRGRGIAEGLIAHAKARGMTLSEREIRHRLQCARTYPTEELIGTVRAVYGAWTDLRDAGFPAVEAPVDEDQVDGEDGASEQEQGGLFPPLYKPAYVVGGKVVPLACTPFERLWAYQREQERMHRNFGALNDRRRADLEEKTAAVGGDLTRTYGEAARRLLGEAE